MSETMSDTILRVAVPAPLYQTFDYLPPHAVEPTALEAGVRVRVPFGRRRVIGVLVATAAVAEVPGERLRRATALVDPQPVLPGHALELARWLAAYYHYPLGEVLSAMLPGPLRRGAGPRAPRPEGWQLTDAGWDQDPQALAKAPRQAALLARLRAHPEGLRAEALAEEAGDWRAALRTLRAKGWVAPVHSAAAPSHAEPGPGLNAAQRAAVATVAEAHETFNAFLLDGVTGSGKTEVYLHLIEQVLAAGRQALVVVPEIALTPQLIQRFRSRLGREPAVLHSGRTEQERLAGWLEARDGQAGVVLGTRSAMLTPLARPGLFIVDEEHDASLKQQEGLRYSARDLAVVRAREAQCPVVLGTATPSLESLDNANRGRYRRLTLPERAGAARPPHIEVLDVRGRSMSAGLSEPLLGHIDTHLAAGGQVLLFLNRRGYAPTLLCHECGWVAMCPRCDAHMIYHHGPGQLRCHQCGSQRGVPRQCPQCGSVDLRALGIGTEQVEQALTERFGDHGVVRIDRDTTRRKGALEDHLDAIRQGTGRLLVGTQMLAKGHHFPDVTLVGVLDGDQGLFGADFRAPERMAQLIMQVAGRAGRADRPGHVLVQTHHPEHPLLRRLIDEGYAAFAQAALAERYEAGLPPATSLALIRAEAPRREAAWAFLDAAREQGEPLADGVELLGPLPAPIERRAGRYRGQLLAQAGHRGALHRLLDPWVRALGDLPQARRVRWSLDVDPLDML